MEASEAQRAVEATRSTVLALDLQVDDAVVVHNSDRIAVRLIPCDVLARVAPSVHQAGSEFEVEVARRLAGTDGPVAELEPRVEPQTSRLPMRRLCGSMPACARSIWGRRTSPIGSPVRR